MTTKSKDLVAGPPIADYALLSDGWRLTKGRPVAGYSGSADGPEHYFKDDESLCGRLGRDAVSMPWMAPTDAPQCSGACKDCRRLSAEQDADYERQTAAGLDAIELLDSDGSA